MPIRSMTGFGAAERSATSGTYRIEIRGVNNRFLEMQVRQPKYLANLEQKIRKVISKAIARGSVQVNIFCDRENEAVKITWDKTVVDGYVAIFREIGEVYGLQGGITLANLLNFNDVVKTENTVYNEEELWEDLGPALEEAIAVFQKSREAEGAFIIADLKKVLDAISTTLEEIETRAPSRIESYTAVLQERVRKLIADPPDPQRMTTEIALSADRLDISEECLRLRAHISRFGEDFGADGPVGKRMGFLLQEMNREANTIGSKANDTDISHLSVALKEKIEQIREQIQNIE